MKQSRKVASLGFLVSIVIGLLSTTLSAVPRLRPHRISLDNGKTFDLNLPEGFEISVAAQGLKRVRFMARSPDDRIFVTDMYNLTDKVEDFITGFFKAGRVHGRPADVFSFGENAVLVTDDYAGVVYYIYRDRRI